MKKSSAGVEAGAVKLTLLVLERLAELL